jgi:hypothetical protein
MKTSHRYEYIRSHLNLISVVTAIQMTQLSVGSTPLNVSLSLYGSIALSTSAAFSDS